MEDNEPRVTQREEQVPIDWKDEKSKLNIRKLYIWWKLGVETSSQEQTHDGTLINDNKYWRNHFVTSKWGI